MYRSLARLALLALALASTGVTHAQRGAPAEKRVKHLYTPAARTPAHSTSLAGPVPPALAKTALPAIVVTGYWPPSNEAVRRFSTDPTSNPNGWIGANWEGRGYDVFSYFPEFSPPTCTFCGKGTGNLTVDYQDTTADFRPLVEPHAPVAVVTLSRGFDDDSWELEMNQYNRTNWFDDYCAPTLPTPNPPDASVPVDYLRPSLLPVQQIADAVNLAGVASAYICFTGNGGGFLSEFIAYLGVWYQDDHRSPTYSDWCVTAGHIHVGGQLTNAEAFEALTITLREVITELDATFAATVCQADLGGGGPGTAQLLVCGQELAAGNTADLRVGGAPPGAFAVIVAGTQNNPLAWKGGLVHPVPPLLTQILPIDASGEGLIEGLGGSFGPATVYTQVVYQDAAQAQGWGFTNVVQMEFL